MVKKVYLGVGHGGADAGAVANGLQEKNVNLAVALACRAVLEESGVQVMISRREDKNDSVAAKVAQCNAFAPDLAADIHFNAGGGDGAEVFYHHGGGRGKVLAENILEELKAIGQNSRGAKIRKNTAGQDYYGFIRSTECPAVITEGAFLDNGTDVQIIDTAAEQAAMGGAIARGFLKTLGIIAGEQPPAEQNYTLEDFIREVQQLCGATVDGIAGPETLGKTVTLSRTVNDYHKLVLPVQKRLAALGYAVGELDGEAGTKFHETVKAFQRDNGCVADGEITARMKTWQKLLGMA